MDHRRGKRLTAWGLAMAAANAYALACTATPPGPIPNPVRGKPAGTGGLSTSSDGSPSMLPIESPPVESSRPTCEEMALQVDAGCSSTWGTIECVHFASPQPALECVEPPLGFGGAAAQGWGGEGGGTEGGATSHEEAATQPMRRAACPAFESDPNRCVLPRCVDSARLFPDGSAECCYRLEPFLCH